MALLRASTKSLLVGRAGSVRAGVDHGPDLPLGGLQAEEGDRPGPARPLSRLEVGVWRKLGDQVEQTSVEGGLGDLDGQFG
jgi:hypothetical protein